MKAFKKEMQIEWGHPLR